MVEKGLCELADANADRFEVWIVRPSGVLASDAGVAMKLTGKLFAAIGVDQLAADMIKIVLDGWESRIVENDVLLNMKV